MNLSKRFGNALEWFKRLITEPFEPLPNLEDQRRGGITSVFLLLSALFVMLERTLVGNILFVALFLLAAGYFLARTRWFKTVALLLIVTLTIPSYLMMFQLPDPHWGNIFSVMAWIIVPLLLSSLIYSVGVTIAIGFINCAVMFALPFMRPELSLSVMWSSIGFYGLSTAVLAVVMIQRDRLELDRQKERLASRSRLDAEVEARNQLARDAQERAEQLSMVNKVGAAISNLQGLDDVLMLIFEQVRGHIQLDAFFISLYDEKTHHVSFPMMYDSGRFWQEKKQPLSPNSAIAKFLIAREPLLWNRTQEEIDRAASESKRLGDKTHITASSVTMPLQFGGRLIGTLSVHSYQMNAYQEKQVSLLTALTQQVAVAIENARLFEEIQQHARRLEILNDVSRAVAELKSLPDLFEIVYDKAQASIPLDAFFIGLHVPEKNEIVFPIMYDDGVRYDWQPAQVSEGSFLARFLRGERAIIVNRTPEEIARNTPQSIHMIGDDQKISASLIVAPLLIGGIVIGVISAQSYTSNMYEDSDLDLLIKIANQIAVAIQNSRLYTSAQQEIAERQKIEEQLRTAEAQYRELVESVPAVIYSSESGASGRWFFVSPQIEDLLGFTVEEWMADPDLWYRQIYSDDRSITIETEMQSIASGSGLEMEYRIYKKNGELIWIRDESRYIIENEWGQKIVHGTLIDVTARKRAELTLRESEERYHSLFLTAERQARDLALLADVQNAITRELELTELLHKVVEMTARAFGYMYVSLYLLDDGMLKLQHQIGYDEENILEVISPQEGVSGRVLHSGQPILVSDVTADPDFLRANYDVQSEISIPLFNGDVIAGVFSVESPKTYPLGHDDLRLIVLLGEQINIGLRRAGLYEERAENLRREQRLNEFAHAINSVLELSDVLKIVAKLNVEMMGAESGAISLMSDDGMNMTDVYTYNDDISIDEIQSKGQGLTWLVYETNTSVNVDEYVGHPDAMPEWVASGVRAFMGVPICIGKKKMGVLAVYNRSPARKFSTRDLSLMEAVAQEVAIAIQNARLYADLQKELEERKRIEHEREAMYRDLETKNAELERFTYTVSHDLKSPLVTIAGFLGFVEDDIHRENFDRLHRSVERIREAAKKMGQLLDELLELSRIGRLANPSVDVPFGELAREAVELVQGELTAKQVEVRIEADLPIVFVDKIRLIEVLQNLISNAIKFMGRQTHPLIEIGLQMQNNERAFYVRDNGMGVAPEFHDRIFGLFNKLDQFSEGTGVGLALVKRIVEVHGGKIWVESELGKGATFFFTLADKNLQETK